MDEGRALALAAASNGNVPIVVYDEGSELSRHAATALENVGYRDVRVYAGGKADWQAAGLPVER
jgi:rhodanese-related sulfurtransferase